MRHHLLPDSVRFYKANLHCHTTISDGALTPAEIASMVRGVFTVTAELAARFLDDYINGDVYFKVNYPEHNLIRARCQLHLAEDIFAKADRLEKKIRNG